MDLFRKKSKLGPKNLIRFYIALNLGEKWVFFAIQNLVDIQSSRFRLYSQKANYKWRSYQADRPLVINLSALLWGLGALKFSFTWVRCKAPPGPPQIWKKVLFVHILGLNLKMSYQIASLFHMYIDMGERIAGKQDRFSLIIEDPLRAPKIPPKYIFF